MDYYKLYLLTIKSRNNDLLQAMEGQQHFDSTYFVPLDLFKEVNSVKDKSA